MKNPVSLAIHPAHPNDAPAARRILLPGTDGAPDPALPAPFAALLPERDHNEAMMRDWLGAPDAAAGLLAGDPFLRLAELRATLWARGCRSVANMPTTALYGADFAATLDDVGIGPAKEFARLRALRDDGFEVLAVLCGGTWLDAALATRPSALILAPDAEARAAEPTVRVRFARLLDQVRAAHDPARGPLPPLLALLDAPPPENARPPAGMAGLVYPSVRPASP